jgi:murein DD-endopeptidase MepM/ murein hydrolase activator NlpD
MTTLHALRRTYALSFSELAALTAVPVRRLAEFEYQGQPLSIDERRSLASLFGITEQAIEGGFVSRHSAQPTLTQNQAKALAALAAITALAWSLRVGQPQLSSGANQYTSASMANGVNAARQLRAAAITATVEPTNTIEPTATVQPTEAPTTVPTATTVPTEIPTATPEPTMAPTATPEPTAVPPTPTKRPIRAFRKVPQPTPTPQIVQAPQAAQTVQKAQMVAPGINLSDSGEPHRCPAVPARGRVILTQGYGVGTHQPADLWGAVDLAVAGGATEGTTVVATHAGYVQVALDSWPGGNFISVVSDNGWRTGYAHLQSVLVESGQYVQAGTPIGTIGSTGHSTGPHLHYETWQNGVNIDPSPRLFCR